MVIIEAVDAAPPAGIVISAPGVMSDATVGGTAVLTFGAPRMSARAFITATTDITVGTMDADIATNGVDLR